MFAKLVVEYVCTKFGILSNDMMQDAKKIVEWSSNYLKDSKMRTIRLNKGKLVKLCNIIHQGEEPISQ